MTIDACQSIAASSQLLCLISIRLIDLDLPVPGNHVSPPFPAYSSEVCSAGRDSNVDRYTMMVMSLRAGADGLTFNLGVHEMDLRASVEHGSF
jgi:hypothetical protein